MSITAIDAYLRQLRSYTCRQIGTTCYSRAWLLYKKGGDTSPVKVRQKNKYLVVAAVLAVPPIYQYTSLSSLVVLDWAET